MTTRSIMHKDTKKTAPASAFDTFLDMIKKVSVISSIVTCLGLVLLYFFGMAIFTSLSSAFGVPPFEFSLQKCLEYGSLFCSQLLAIIPMLVMLGLKSYFNDADLQTNLLLALPLVSIGAIRCISSRSRLYAARFLPWAVTFALLYMLLYLTVIYLGMVATATPCNLLLDPAVNIALQHKQELANGVHPAAFGIRHWDYMTLNTVIKDSDWKYEKIGILYLLLLVSVVYSCTIIVLSGKALAKNELTSQRFQGWVFFLRRLLISAFLLFLGGFLFILAGRTSVLLATIFAQKVDIALSDRTDMTSQYYAVPVAEYENDYVFYFPNLQQLLRVQKNKVESILVKGEISIFADRYFFKKGAWLGLSGVWDIMAPGKSTGEKEPRIIGYKVTEVFLNSPAYKAGILAHDSITAIGGIPIDGLQKIEKIVGRMPVGTDVQIILRRGGVEKIFSVMVENRP